MNEHCLKKEVVSVSQRAADNSTAVESTVNKPVHGHHSSSHTGTANTSCVFRHLLFGDIVTQPSHKVRWVTLSMVSK